MWELVWVLFGRGCRIEKLRDWGDILYELMADIFGCA
jgi:hypothetical protein